MALQTVLLTGVTGFIGGATLARLLELQPECRVLVLARDRGSDSAADRVLQSISRFVGSERAANLLPFCDVIVGDLTNPETRNDHRLDDVSHVLHLASNTNFRSVRRVRQTNILGALALAHRMRRVPHLQRFLSLARRTFAGPIHTDISRRRCTPGPVRRISPNTRRPKPSVRCCWKALPRNCR